MLLKLVRLPDRLKAHRSDIRSALKFYSTILLGPRLTENIELDVEFDPTLHERASEYAFMNPEDDGRSPRWFTITVDANMEFDTLLKTLAHEMVHVKQLIHGETNDSLSMWRGKRIDSDKVDYWLHPWEIDAHGREAGLMTKFTVEEELWDVFQGFKNPNTPIVSTPIKWK